MDVLIKFLRDRGNNNLVVAFLLAFATVNFVQDTVSFWDAGPGDYWVGHFTRSIITYLILLAIAWAIAKAAR
jgi:uncharacterized membrane protein